MDLYWFSNRGVYNLQPIAPQAYGQVPSLYRFAADWNHIPI